MPDLDDQYEDVDIADLVQNAIGADPDSVESVLPASFLHSDAWVGSQRSDCFRNP
jgi:hypothetical protein